MEKKIVGVYALLAVILVTAIGGVAVGALMFQKIDAVNKTVKELTEEDETQQEQEDDVSIAGQYMIKSTTAISDAYKSGDESALSDEDKETLQMASEVLKELDINDTMTDYEKELAVYEWIVDNIGQGSNSISAVSENPDAVSRPYGVLKNHSAVCVGYATTFRLFMQMLGIDCMVVHNLEKYHSWDLVKLDDDWYHVDCYTDAGWVKYTNFNLSDELSARGHEWNREFWPAAIGMKYNYAIVNSVNISDVFEIPQKLRESLEQGGDNLYFNIGEDEENYKENILLAMYSKAMDITSTYCDITFSLFTDNDSNKILSILIYKYNNGSDASLSQEDQAKLDEAMQNAFQDYAGEGMTDDQLQQSIEE